MTVIKKLFTIILPALGMLLPSVSHASSPQSEAGPAQASEYVAVALDTFPPTDGKALMIAAYAVILGLFLAYGVSLVLREKSIERRALDLKKRLENR